MCRMNVPAYFGSLSFSIFLLASMTSTHTLYAQNAPAPGTAVVVRMMDAMDSGTDPAGKQYRASSAKLVNAGNGVMIAQGAAATVTLVRSGSGWTVQLSSLTINGLAVAVTSSSASVTSAAQNAAGSAVSAMGSVLGGLGHHTNVPSSVAAVATGQRVVLPIGTTLNFVLAATAPANALPAVANAAPAVPPSAASVASASGPGSYYHCKYWGLKGTREIVYSTPVIHSDAAATTISTAFVHYIQATYPVSNLKQDSGFCETFSAFPSQQVNSLNSEEKQWASSNWEVVHIDWTYTPGQAAAPTVSSPASPSSSSSTGLYLYCFSDPDGQVIYFSDFFVADPDSSGQRGVSFRNVGNAYLIFLQQKYSFKSGSNYPTGCSNAVNSGAGLRYAQTHKQQMEDQYKQASKQIVETGWKYTPGPGAADPTPTPPARLHH